MAIRTESCSLKEAFGPIDDLKAIQSILLSVAKDSLLSSDYDHFLLVSELIAQCSQPDHRLLTDPFFQKTKIDPFTHALIQQHIVGVSHQDLVEASLAAVEIPRQLMQRIRDRMIAVTMSQTGAGYFSGGIRLGLESPLILSALSGKMQNHDDGSPNDFGWHLARQIKDVSKKLPVSKFGKIIGSATISAIGTTTNSHTNEISVYCVISDETDGEGMHFPQERTFFYSSKLRKNSPYTIETVSGDEYFSKTYLVSDIELFARSLAQIEHILEIAIRESSYIVSGVSV